MIHILTLGFALTSTLWLVQATAPLPSPLLVRVWVQTDDGGEASELADRRQSVKDLASTLAGKKKAIVIIDDEDKADVVLEVIDRGVTVPRIVLGIGSKPGQLPGTSGPVRHVVLRVKLTLGLDPPVEFTNKNKAAESPRGWKAAADDIGDQVEKWVTARREGILSRRRSGDANAVYRPRVCA